MTYLVCFSGLAGDYVRYSTNADSEIQAVRNALNGRAPYRDFAGVAVVKVYLLENPFEFRVGHLIEESA